MVTSLSNGCFKCVYVFKLKINSTIICIITHSNHSRTAALKLSEFHNLSTISTQFPSSDLCLCSVTYICHTYKSFNLFISVFFNSLVLIEELLLLIESQEKVRHNRGLQPIEMPSRGAAGVRQYHKENEARILSHRRAGYGDQEIDGLARN